MNIEEEKAPAEQPTTEAPEQQQLTFPCTQIGFLPDGGAVFQFHLAPGYLFSYTMVPADVDRFCEQRAALMAQQQKSGLILPKNNGKLQPAPLGTAPNRRVRRQHD